MPKWAAFLRPSLPFSFIFSFISLCYVSRDTFFISECMSFRQIDIDLIRLSRFQATSDAVKPTDEELRFAEQTAILAPAQLEWLRNRTISESVWRH